MEFQTVFQTNKSADDLIKALEATLAEQKFSILWHLHINEKLAEKGLTIGPDAHVLEICSAPRAKQAIDINSKVVGFLPCKVTVKQEGGHTEVALLKPTLLMNFMGDQRLEPLAQEVEEALVVAIEAAV